MSRLEFIEKPERRKARGNRNGAIKTFVEQLTKHPNRWAVYRRFHDETVAPLTVKRRVYSTNAYCKSHFPHLRWEIGIDEKGDYYVAAMFPKE